MLGLHGDGHILNTVQSILDAHPPGVCVLWTTGGPNFLLMSSQGKAEGCSTEEVLKVVAHACATIQHEAMRWLDEAIREAIATKQVAPMTEAQIVATVSLLWATAVRSAYAFVASDPGELRITREEVKRG